MVVKVSKPEINVREKISDLDYGHVPYHKMPAGSVIQVQHDTLTDNGVNTSVNNTTHYGLVDITLYRKSANSSLLINLDATQMRPTTSGESRTGYRYQINDGAWKFENSQWKYTGDAITWYRIALTFQETFSGAEGDKIRIQSAFTNTVATTTYIRTPSITVLEIK